MTAGGPESLNNVASTFFNAVLLLPNDLRFEHGDTELASCHGRHLIMPLHGSNFYTSIRQVLQAEKKFAA